MGITKLLNKAKAEIKNSLSDARIEHIRKSKIQWKAFFSYLRHHRVNSRKLDKTEKVKIAFIVYSPQSWNSLKTIYIAASKNTNVITHVIVLPYDLMSSSREVISSYTYFLQECPEAVEAYKNGRLLDLKRIKPNVVFRQSPYDNLYPKEYSYEELAKYTKVCYVPYNYNSSPLKHLQIEYSDVMFRNVYAIFSDNMSNFEYCLRRKEEVKWYKGLNIYYLGFPRFDLYADSGREQDVLNGKTEKSTCFTWMPRWSTDSINNDATSFFDYCENLIKYFIVHGELQLIIRPHPMMFSNFIEKGAMSEKAVAEFCEKIRSLSNISFDNNWDYIETFSITDVLIADFSSLDIEFFITGKPVIYCGNMSEFNKETKRMSELFYTVNNWDEMKFYLDRLSSGVDKNKEERYKSIQDFLKGMPENIGETILNECLKFA